MIPLSWYLLLGAALFCIGIYGVFVRRNAVAILMAVELMLNAVNINLIAFWRYLTVAAAEAAVGLALIISIYRSRDSVIAEDMDLMKN